ncbi:MAG: hypothetical protein B0W54_23485 [Cellvibrio sp. 79]|nr:MAG: hypothetical protein B0W54_23485 [Cellvibrio sp. 79]
MITPKEFSTHVKTLLRRNGSLTTGSRLKILEVIHKQSDQDFSDVDIYRQLQEENKKVSVSTINKNLKSLCTMGLLSSSKTNLAVTVYRKSCSFKKLLSETSIKLNLLAYEVVAMDHYVFAALAR